MVGPSVESHDVTPKRSSSTDVIKFLCSYGGKILPRYPDGKLRYHGGETRLLAVKDTVSFAELILKMEGLCATFVSLRCQLPTEDIDALISVNSDKDLANLIEEYSHAISVPSGLQIRAFLSLTVTKKISPPPTPPSSHHATKIGFSPLMPKMVMVMPRPQPQPVWSPHNYITKFADVKKMDPHYGYVNRGGRIYLVHHNGNRKEYCS